MSNILEAAKFGLYRELKGHSVSGWRRSEESYPSEAEARVRFKEVEYDKDNHCWYGRYRVEIAQDGKTELWPDPETLTAEGRKEFNVDTWGQTVRVVGTILTKEFLHSLQKNSGVNLGLKGNSPLENLKNRIAARRAGKPLKSANYKSKKLNATRANQQRSAIGLRGAIIPGRGTSANTKPATPVGRAASVGHSAKPSTSKPVSSPKKPTPAKSSSKSSSSKKKSTGLGIGKMGKKRK